jgi:hypothetical protein
VNHLKAFVLFWYDFLVGDSIWLAIGGVCVLALGYGLVQGHLGVVAEILIPIVSIATIWISLPMRSRG